MCWFPPLEQKFDGVYRDFVFSINSILKQMHLGRIVISLYGLVKGRVHLKLQLVGMVHHLENGMNLWHGL